jgi:hypothetical protein
VIHFDLADLGSHSQRLFFSFSLRVPMRSARRSFA